MSWCGYLTKEDWFLKLAMMWLHLWLDVFWMLTIPIGFVILFIPNLGFIVGSLVYAVLDREKQLSFLNAILEWIGYDLVYGY